LKFISTPLDGLYVVELERRHDDRGFFARAFCMREFQDHCLEQTVAQCNISYNEKEGTLRGLHYQASPYEEAKLVRCTRGGIYDVAVDIRPDSGTYLKWFATELTSVNERMMFIPKGFAHGFQTLVDKSEVFYLMSQFYHPESARGIRYDDPKLAINWPIARRVISDKDRSYALIGAASE
jgi:dTDP-4-dehydrorhamnose 3,5-epimerase